MLFVAMLFNPELDGEYRRQNQYVVNAEVGQQMNDSTAEIYKTYWQQEWNSSTLTYKIFDLSAFICILVKLCAKH